MSEVKNAGASRRELLKGAALGALTAAGLSLTEGCGGGGSTGTGTDAGAPLATDAGVPAVDAGVDAGTTVSCPSTTPSFLTPPTAIPASSIAATVNADVVVVGGGVAGCSAACSAAERGLKVVLLEKSKQVNGRGFGAGAADSKTLRELKITIDRQAAQKLWVKTCGSRVNEQLVSLFFNRSGEVMDWIIDKIVAAGGKSYLWSGYDHDPMFPDQPAYHILVMPDWSRYGGQFMADVLRDGAIAKGATFVYQSPGQQLVQENGKVVAVIAKDASGVYTRYNASKGVVLATGDIAADSEMVDAYCPEAKNVIMPLYTPVGMNTGDGHKMGLWAGGAMQQTPFPPMLHPQVYAYYHAAFLFVNTAGERFMNEATWVQGKSLNIMRQPNHYAWAIFDKNWLAQLVKGLPVGGGMFWDQFRFWGSEFDQAGAQKTVDDTVAAGETGFKADTLAALAGLIKVDPTALAATVARYNQLAQAGSDTDFAKDTKLLDPVAEGPFYAMKIGPGLLSIVGGLKIDTKMNVLTGAGAKVPGLFAAGNTSGDMYAVDYPINIPGNSHTRALLTGYLAAETLAT